jgi:hypothetical protein
MGLLGNIFKKLGFAPDVAKAATAPEAAPAPKPAKAASGPYPPASKPAPQAAKVPSAIPVVDVVAKLEGLAAKNPQKLNWKTSIVDLLKLLDIDSSLEARKELATELHAPAGVMGDSAAMNTWLHKAVLRKLAENGGNVPKELLD